MNALSNKPEELQEFSTSKPPKKVKQGMSSTKECNNRHKLKSRKLNSVKGTGLKTNRQNRSDNELVER